MAAMAAMSGPGRYDSAGLAESAMAEYAVRKNAARSKPAVPSFARASFGIAGTGNWHRVSARS